MATKAKICLTSQGQLLILSDSGISITIDDVSLEQIVVCDVEQKEALFLNKNEATVLIRMMKFCMTQKLSDEARTILSSLLPAIERMG